MGAISNLPAGAPAPQQAAAQAPPAQPASPVTFDSAPTSAPAPAPAAGGGITFDSSPTAAPEVQATQQAATPQTGVMMGAPDVPDSLNTNATNTGSAVGDVAENAAKEVNAVGAGIGQGALSTLHGLGEIQENVASKLPDFVSNALLGSKEDRTTAVNWLQQQINKLSYENQGNQVANMVGYGGETLAEFLSGEGEAKSLIEGGAGIADHFLNTGKVAQVLTKNPRVMSALKYGASMLKAGIDMSPEELAFVKEHPVLGKLASLGHTFLQQGATGAGQEFVRTGGSVPDAVKAGVIQGAAGGVGEGVLGAAGAMASKIGNAGETAAKLAEVGASAPSDLTLAQSIQSRLINAEDHLHTNYENQTNDFADRLEGSEVDAKDSPLAEKAGDILQKPDPDDPDIVKQVQEARGQMLDKKTISILENIRDGKKALTDEDIAEADEANKNKPQILDSKGKAIESEDVEPEAADAEPYDARSVIKLRQEIRALAASYPPGDVNARALKRLLWDAAKSGEEGEGSSAFDDTFQQLAEQSDDPSVAGEYSALRQDYRNKIGRYDDPVIKQLMAGKVDDAAKSFIGKVNAAGFTTSSRSHFNYTNLSQLLGDKATTKFGNQVFRTLVDKANGNPAEIVNTWNKIPEQTKLDLFKTGNPKSAIASLMKDAGSAANVQKLVRAGLLAAGGALGVENHAIGYPLATLLGYTVLGGSHGGIAEGSKILDYVANSPKTWAAFRAIGRAADSKAAATAGKAINATIKGGTAVANQPAPDPKKATFDSIQGLGKNPNQGKPLTSLAPDPPSDADPAADSAASPTDNPAATADHTISQLPPEVQNATSTVPVQVTKGQPMADPNGRSSTQQVAANVDQGAGNNTIEVNNPQAASDPATMAHELTHVWQNNLPPSVQAKIPDDPKDMSAFDISNVGKLRAQGKTLADLPREQAATVVQKYIQTKDPKVKAKLAPWVADLTRTPLSSTLPTAPNATGLNMTPRAPGRPDVSVAGAYPKSK